MPEQGLGKVGTCGRRVTGAGAVTTAPDGPSVACGDGGSTPGLGGRAHLHLGTMLGT